MSADYPHLFNHVPRPDAASLIEHLLGRRQRSTVPMIEFIVDEPVVKAVTTNLFNRSWVPFGKDRESQTRYLDNLIFFWQRMGYDLMRYENALDFPGTSRMAQNTATNEIQNRSWAEESQGMIASWEDFERYPFPRVEDFDFFPFEYLNRHLPEGMGLALAHGGGIFERVSWIFSIEKLCFLLYDQPELVSAVTQKVSDLQLAFYRHLLELDRLTAIFPGDDMGFRTATTISPAALRQYFLPFHTRLAEMSHARGVPYFLHSCGNLLKIMPDLLDTVKIDGKHSYEDAIMPIEIFQEKFGSRTAVLGGMDIHLLATAPEADIRARVRQLIATCGPRGRFAIGSGNSIPDYVPLKNYLAMMDEILAQNQ